MNFMEPQNEEINMQRKLPYTNYEVAERKPENKLARISEPSETSAIPVQCFNQLN